MRVRVRKLAGLGEACVAAPADSETFPNLKGWPEVEPCSLKTPCGVWVLLSFLGPHLPVESGGWREDRCVPSVPGAPEDE